MGTAKESMVGSKTRAGSYSRPKAKPVRAPACNAMRSIAGRGSQSPFLRLTPQVLVKPVTHRA